VAVDGVDIMHGGVPSVTRTVEIAEKDAVPDRLSAEGEGSSSQGPKYSKAGRTDLDETSTTRLEQGEGCVGRDSPDVTMTRRSENRTVIRGAFPREDQEGG